MNLVERISSGVEKRIAILGLHRGAGKVTTLSHLVRGLHDAGIGVGIVAAGRDDEEVDNSLPPRQVRIPVRPGTIVATTESAAARGNAALETMESTGIETTHGPILVMRVTSEGEVEPVGPGAASDLRTVVDAVARHTQEGRTLVEGSFNRRSFAAPGIADGLIVSAGRHGGSSGSSRDQVLHRVVLTEGGRGQCGRVPSVAEREGAATRRANTVVGGIPWRTNGNADLLFAQKNPPSRLVVPRSVVTSRDPAPGERTLRDRRARPVRIALSPCTTAHGRSSGRHLRHPLCKVVALS